MKRLPSGSGSRKRLAVLLTRIPRAKRRRLNSAGKLRFLLALPEARLAPRRQGRKFQRRTLAARRRLNRLPPSDRLALLNTYTRLRKGGLSGSQAARQAGASVPTLWRWSRAYAQQGLAGLAPRFHRSGRKGFTVAVPAEVLARVFASVRRLNVERGGNERAWQAYLASPQCPAEIRTALAGRGIPDALLAATRVNRSKVTCHTGEGLLAVGPLPGAVTFHFLNS